MLKRAAKSRIIALPKEIRYALLQSKSLLNHCEIDCSVRIGPHALLWCAIFPLKIAELVSTWIELAQGDLLLLWASINSGKPIRAGIVPYVLARASHPLYSAFYGTEYRVFGALHVSCNSSTTVSCKTAKAHQVLGIVRIRLILYSTTANLPESPLIGPCTCD